jgi:hypothetical protein
VSGSESRSWGSRRLSRRMRHGQRDGLMGIKVGEKGGSFESEKEERKGVVVREMERAYQHDPQRF